MRPPTRSLGGRARAWRVLFAASWLAALLGCDSQSGDGTVDPPHEPEETLLSRLWPNHDGNQWAFDYQRHHATEPMIAELNGLGDLEITQIDYRDLEERLTGELPDRGETEAIGTASLRFEGTIKSLDGPKQNLVSDLVPISSSTRAGATRFPEAATVPPLIARIYAARPDLRERMVALGYVPARFKASAPQAWPPFSFIDTKFEMQTDWVGMYGDLSAESSYTFIQNPIEEGASFRHQLVPDLADDIWEYGWILGEREIETPAGTFDDAVGVVYFIDFGLTAFVDEGGNEVESFRSFSIVSLYLAPDVGPVYQRAIDYLSPPIPELEIGIGILFSEAALRDYELR